MILHVDDAPGRTNALVSDKFAKAVGLTVVGQEFYPSDIKDYGPLVTRALQQKFDAIEIGVQFIGELCAWMPAWRE